MKAGAYQQISTSGTPPPSSRISLDDLVPTIQSIKAKLKNNELKAAVTKKQRLTALVNMYLERTSAKALSRVLASMIATGCAPFVLIHDKPDNGEYSDVTIDRDVLMHQPLSSFDVYHDELVIDSSKLNHSILQLTMEALPHGFHVYAAYIAFDAYYAVTLYGGYLSFCSGFVLPFEPCCATQYPGSVYYSCQALMCVTMPCLVCFFFPGCCK